MKADGKCAGCGAPFEARARTCTYCGAALPRAARARSPAAQQAEAESLRAFRRAHRGATWGIGLIGLAIVLVGAVTAGSSFGAVPALLFLGFGVVWILVFRAILGVTKAQDAFTKFGSTSPADGDAADDAEDNDDEVASA